MKKLFNFLLIFTLVFALFGFASQKTEAEATEDVTIYLHIHQFDGDYTNTGTGIWDGVNWNNWTDVVSDTDNFGGVVVKTYTAAEINAVSDSIEFKPTKDVNVDDAMNYLAPASAEGKVFADVTSLKDGSKTELHLFYVEGALDFYTPKAGNGAAFVVYADPKVAADETVYDSWNLWTWNTGTNGSAPGDANANDFGFAVDMELTAGDYVVPAKLAVIEVDDDAEAQSGFIVRQDEWTAKQCGQDMFIDNTNIKGSGAEVYYYHADSCELETDYTAYNMFIAEQYEINAGNRFLEGTYVMNPSAISVELLMPKNPAAYEVGRFMVKDKDGNSIPILGVNPSTTGDLGAYTSDVTCAEGEYKFVLYVETSLDHSKLGVVGSLQGWNIDAPVGSTKDDENGLAVFEICSVDPTGEFKVKYDLDGDGFTWDGELDPEITPNNQAFDLTDGMMGIYYLFVSDIQVGGFQSELVLTETEKLVKVYVDTDVPAAQLGVAGDFQGWDPANAVAASGTDELSGYVVFEFKSATPTAQFVILNDADANGWSWDDAKINVAGDYTVDLGEDLVQTVMIDVAGDMVSVVPEGIVANTVLAGDYTYTAGDVCTSPENKLTVFVDTDLDHTMLGLVGSVQGWNIDAPLAAIGETDGGLVVFEACTADAAGEYKIKYDPDGDGFTWDGALDPEVTPNNMAFSFGEGATDAELAQLVTGTELVFSPFESALTIESVEFNHFILYVKTDVPAEQLGVAGDFQGWSPENAVTFVGTDSYGHVIFEFRSTSSTAQFVILNDADANGFSWDDAKINVAGDYTMDLGEDASQMLYIDAAMDYTEIVTIGSELSDLDTTMVELTFAEDTLMYGMEYFVEYMDSDELTIMTEEAIPFMTSNEFVAGSGIEMMGTYAATPTMIYIELANASMLLDSMKLKADGVEVAGFTYDYMYGGAGEFTPTISVCDENKNLLTVHLNVMNTEVVNMDDIALVGSVQGWSPENGIAPSGMDANGNYVFEVCADTTRLNGNDEEIPHGFKILHEGEADSGFAWGDTELTPSDVEFLFDGDVTLYVEEGNGSAGSALHMISLPTSSKIDVTKDYVLEFVDENGFVVYTAVDIDSEKPVADYAFIPDKARTLVEGSTFNIMDYFTKLQFLDNRDGELAYEVVTAIDPNVVGAQTLVLRAVDSWMNEGTVEFNFTVTAMPDTTPPVITGDATLTVTVGDDEPTWLDYVTTDDGTITVNTSQVDMDSEGTFFVIFTATDAAGNSASHSLEVTVEAAPVDEPADTGCFGAINITSLVLISILGGAALYFVRKR